MLPGEQAVLVQRRSHDLFEYVAVAAHLTLLDIFQWLHGMLVRKQMRPKTHVTASHATMAGPDLAGPRSRHPVIDLTPSEHEPRLNGSFGRGSKPFR